MVRDTLPRQEQPLQSAPPLYVAPKRKHGCLPKLLTLLVVLGVLGAGGYVASGPYRTLQGLRAALAQNDTNALDQYVDFPTLRQNLKLQLLAQTNTGLNSVLPNGIVSHIAGGIASTLVDTTVDALVTPSGINRLVSGTSVISGQQPSPGAPPTDPLANARSSYQSLSLFAVTLTTSAGNIILELTRSGLDWRLTNVKIASTQGPTRQTSP